ncbi:hypothetical protein V5O48_016544 [Marasmius crinis-equi]|uniref:Uncharacterized protein n=1 Tax=Marasmius crinis-equi TaxID=585013 RepID=A0ABR3ERH4_9AGAR
MKSCWSSAPPSRPTAEALLGAMDVMEAGASVSPLPNWDQSVFTPVWENVEYSPLACGDEGMPESKARSSQKASLAHSATPGTGASQQAIPNRSVANLEVHDLTNPVLISLHLQPQTHLGQSYAPFIPSRGRKRKASNEDPPMIHLKPKRALDASEGALVRLPTIRGQSNSLVSTSTTVPGTLNNNTTDVDIDIANGAPQKRRSGFSGDDTALPDRLTERNPQNRMSPPAWPGYNGGHSDLPGQNPFNLNPHMMLQALYRDQLNDQQLEPESLAQNHQTQNHPLNFVDRLNSGGLVRQGGGPNSGDPTNSKMNQPGGRSRIESHLTPSGGAETVRRSPPTHTHPSDQSSQQPQLGGADTGPSSGDPQATQKASLMDGRGGRVFTLPNLQDRESAIKDTLAQTRVQMRSLEAALLTRW